jgi:hypothetical protein
MLLVILRLFDPLLQNEHRYVIDTGIDTTHQESEGRMYEQSV